MKQLLSICVLISMANAAFAQNTSDSLRTQNAYEAELMVRAVWRGDSVVLRWAPETPGAWQESNKSGYVIFRATLDENGAFDPATFQKITTKPVKPWPLERWASIAGEKSNDDFARIAAQALYGKNFSPVNGFIAKADEFATRFSFAMLAADLSPQTAHALGLRFSDPNIEKGKSYLYRIVHNAENSGYTIHPGVAVVHTTSPEPVPVALIDHVNERENLIEIYWNRQIHSEHFSAYFIERSDDNGKSFKRLNATPYVHAVSERIPMSVDHFVYLDSVNANYRTYQYRVVGITPFGEIASPSQPVSAMGKDRTPPMQPQNVQAKHVGGTSIRITWDYPKQSKEIRGFLIGRGNNPTKTFTPLTDQPLPARTREFIDNGADPMASNFYVVAAVDTAGNASVSLAQYAMIIDSIPPAPPVGLTGIIDTTGVVTVSWKPGNEQDIDGYLVFYANSPDHEFSQLTHGPLRDTVFQDTITLKTLTKKIYYRVVALDYNANYSGFSKTLELERPDVVPPSAAVMDYYKITERGIELRWVPSSSEDLARTVLYRLDERKQWREIGTFAASDKQNSFVDTTALVAGKLYGYSLVSFDEAGLQSKRSVPIRIKWTDLKARLPVDNIFAKADPGKKNILLEWNYPVKGEYRFIVYRAVNGSGFNSYKSIQGNLSSFADPDVKPGSTYEYSVGVVFKDGRKAPFGKVIKTTF